MVGIRDRAALIEQYLPRRRRSTPGRRIPLAINLGLRALFVGLALVSVVTLSPANKSGYSVYNAHGLIQPTDDGYSVRDSGDWPSDSASPVVGDVFCWRVETRNSLLCPFRSASEDWVMIVTRRGPTAPNIIELFEPSFGWLLGLPTSPPSDRIPFRDYEWSPRAIQENAKGAFRLFCVDRDPPQILWLGLAANAAGLVFGLALLFFAFRWLGTAGNRLFGPMSDWWRLRRRWRQLSRGRCPVCAYDIRHTPENRCPECGNTWRPEEPGMLEAISGRSR